MSQSQRRIQDFFRTGDSTTPVTDSSTRGLTNTVEDLHLSAEGQALPGKMKLSRSLVVKLKVRLMNLQIYMTPPRQSSLPVRVCAGRLVNANVVLMLALLTILWQWIVLKRNSCIPVNSMVSRFQSKYSLKMNLRASNFQKFPGGHAPRPP